MIKLRGEGIHPGIAIATAAVMDLAGGTSSLPYSILERAMGAMRRQLAESEQPEVVLITDQLALGAAVRIPGLQKAALIAQSPDGAQGLQSKVPCVVGVSEATTKIPNDAIVIVDGYSGEIVVDPDATTVIHYQEEIERRKQERRKTQASAQLPVQTSDGRVITVSARLKTLDDLQSAVRGGADSLTTEISLFDPDCEDLTDTIMGAAGGKPVTIIPDQLYMPFLTFLTSLSIPGQLTLAFPGTEFVEQKELLEQIVGMVEPDEATRSFPMPKLAVIAQSADDMALARTRDVRVLLERPAKELEGAVKKWVSDGKPGRLTVCLGDSLEMLPAAVKAGALAVETTPELVSEAKNLIRSL